MGFDPDLPFCFRMRWAIRMRRFAANFFEMAVVAAVAVILGIVGLIVYVIFFAPSVECAP